MKHIKKVITLLLAAMMVLAMSSVAFAADHTVSTTSDSHTYEIYQIFTGTYDSTSGQLQNLKYGQNAKTGTSGESVSQTDMAALDAIAKASYANDQARITALSPYVDLDTTPIKEIGKGKDASASLAEGYYIIKDTDNSLEDPETYTLYLFKVLSEDLTITPKDGTTTVDKDVTETNDTAGTTTAGQNGADYDEGDSIPYSIDITLAKNVTDYKTYTVTLTDTLSEGLTPPAEGAITVTLKDKNGTAITGFGTPTATVSGQKITVTYTVSGVDGAAIGTAGAALNEAVINVSYEAVLNNKAVVGDAGNPNTYTITYSNNPNGDDTGKTPDKVVKVFTYEIEIEKKDGNDEPLAGAGFTLYKEVAGVTTGEGASATTTYPEGAKTGAAIKADLAEGVDAHLLVDTKYYVPVTMTENATSDKVTHKTDKTIDAGTYILIETTVPAGYNAYEGDTIVVTSTIDADGNLTGLSATGPTGISADKTSGLVSAGVVNQSGTELPSTGGIGTIIFYVLGSLLVVGCGIVLISKRRVNANK